MPGLGHQCLDPDRQVDELNRLAGRDADPAVVADWRGHECLHGASSCCQPADLAGGTGRIARTGPSGS